ncbi:MAG: DUF3047 domain-containing protein [Pseudomonadota bacterium]
MFLPRTPMKIARLGMTGGCLVMALLAALLHPAAAQTLTPFAGAESDTPAPPWRVVGLPNTGKTLTRFDIIKLDSAAVLRIRADDSYANLVHDLPALTVGPGTLLRWRWRLDQTLPLADLTRKSGDDVPVKVCALFDMPTTQLGLIDRSFLHLARAVSHDFVPAATLCYVWDHQLPVGTELPNAFTRRVRYLVLNSGTSQLKQWVVHERDLAADFQRAFGHETEGIPPLRAILVGADSDNTNGASLAYVSDLQLKLRP